MNEYFGKTFRFSAIKHQNENYLFTVRIDGTSTIYQEEINMEKLGKISFFKNIEFLKCLKPALEKKDNLELKIRDLDAKTREIEWYQVHK